MHLFRMISDETVLGSYIAVNQAGVRIPRGLERPQILYNCAHVNDLFLFLLCLRNAGNVRENRTL